MTDISNVEKLSASHTVSSFKCTNYALNHWLKRYALINQKADSTQTYVVHRANAVIAYYSLVYGDIALNDCPSMVKRDLPTHYPVPIIKIARLAVDKKEEGKGIGRALMKDAFLRIIRAAEIAGLRAIVVDAMDELAKGWYQKNFGFELSPVHPLLLFLRIEDLRISINAVMKTK